jgi:uncharacterized protein YlxW (UPF0749 family)
MMNKTSQSSDKLPTPDSGATDSRWQPSWWQWLISALSGTVETEKQIAWLNKREEEAKRQHEQKMRELNKREEEAKRQHEQRMRELNKREEEAKRQHEQRMKELQQDTEKYSAIAEQIEKDNERLAVLESKIDGLFSKYGIKSNPANPTEEP